MTGQGSPGMTDRRVQLGDLLLKEGLINEQRLESALDVQRREGHRRLLGEILIELGFVTEEQVQSALAHSYGIPFVTVSPRVADPKVIELLPRDFLEKQCVLPLFLIRNRLTVAVAEPANLFLVEEVERLSGNNVQIVASTRESIQETLRQYLPRANVFVIDDIYDDLDDDDFTVVEREITDLANLEEVSGHSPVVKMVNFLIYSAVHEGASDIHIEPEEGRLRVRYRIDGKLFLKICPPAAMHPAIVSRIKIMSGLDISERRVPQDGDIGVMLDGRPVDLRVSTMPGKYGEKVVIRVIDSANAIVGITKLGLSGDMLERWKQAIRHPHGVILVTGPTGSGKSTTLYSVISELNSDDINISTVEDPVEAGLSGVNQFQVNDRSGFTFAGALRGLLRQDPDIIMVGEVRDGETARIVSQAALTGHLVLSTLHTNDAPSAITRMVDLGIEPYLVAAILRAVLAQRLVRRVCLHCKEPFDPDATARQAVETIVGEIPSLWRGVGCEKCRSTGYSGRMGIFELFTPKQTWLERISQGADLHEIRSMLQKDGFEPLRIDGLRKAAQGQTSVEEVFYATAG